ncbi:helix-turn-helix transcriptional regulator [Gracilibacillus lacisalsi]|uniref:helix-turn-helix transcriptional regulator n=1 Tax=Gracilibacillus lacisalsi TaxID=393087 RepID=UPI000373545C|nr:AraC family transcriptional regulator [Gracilibacillus lacisalsi]
MGQFPKAVAYYYKRWHEFEMDLHHHPAIEIMYVMDGKCQIEIDDRIVHMRKGQYIYIQSNVKHRLIIDKDHPCRMLNIEFILHSNKTTPYISIEQLFQTQPSIRSLFDQNERYFLLKDDEAVYFTLRHLVLELDHQSANNQLLIDNLMVQLLLWIDRNRREYHEQTGNQHIKKALTYIHEHYDTEIKVERLASITHLHPSYLHKIFRRSQGMTINQYITKVRLEKAKMLLVNTEIPVTEISNYVGVNTSQYFSNLFKKETGLSPSAYREHSREI